MDGIASRSVLLLVAHLSYLNNSVEFQDARSLDSFKWYKGLYAYSRPGEEDLEERELGPDGDLVASMISTAVIPRLCKVVEGGAFDVYSHIHVRRMIDLAEEVEASLDPANPKFEVRKPVIGYGICYSIRGTQTLLRSASSVFQSAVAESEGLLAPHKDARHRPAGFDPEAITARRRFLARRVKLLRNLLRWRKYAGDRFGLGLLVGRLVEASILEMAKGGWEVGGEEVARKVSESSFTKRCVS